MKKLLLLSLIFSAIISSTVSAQSGPQARVSPDQATILQAMKEQQKPGLVEKAGLTDVQADRVIEINLELRQTMMSDFRNLNEADRTKRLAEFKAAKEKKYSDIPLNADQIKAVYAFYEDRGKNMQKKNGN